MHEMFFSFLTGRKVATLFGNQSTNIQYLFKL